MRNTSGTEHPRIVTQRVTDLVPYARNARTHSDAQVAQIAASITEFGFCNPILTQGRQVVAGHGRLLAARKLGLAEVPTIDLAHLTKTQARAYVLADNQLATNAGWDAEMLAMELVDLKAEGVDLDLLGFPDVGALLAPPAPAGLLPGTDEDAVPEAPKVAVTQPGDVITLGRHRLMCGDSTKADDVARLMDGQKAALVLTDPPYGLGDTNSEKNDYSTYDDTKANLVDLVAGFLPLAQEVAPVVVLTPGTKNHGIYPVPNWVMAWFTPAGTGCGPWGFCCWQPILCYGKDPKLSKGKGSHPDAIVHTEASEKFGHPCTKPINFWKWLMERTSEPGELIYEPFSGSGTTHIAAEVLGRKCYGMELDPIYCDVIINRWEQATGQKAVRHG